MVDNRIGILAFMNDGGLGAQTRRLTYMINPYRLLVVDSSGFSKNKVQHPEWYSSYNGYIVDGFPTNSNCRKFVNGLEHILVCENPLNYYMISYAHHVEAKTYIQVNYEFLDTLANPSLPLPTKFLMPSYWMIDEMIRLYGKDRVMYLPPPIDMHEFDDAYRGNKENTGKFRILHMIGTLAAHDRNGTLDLIKALPQITSDFELVIHSQSELPKEYITKDERVIYNTQSVAKNEDLYRGFDLMLLPRRYAGLCLPMWEALASGVPVMMTDISPNNKYLPKDWLIPATKTHEFMTRTLIDVHASVRLAECVDDFVSKRKRYQDKARLIASRNVSTEVLKPEYDKLWS